MKDKDGNVITKLDKQLERWKDHFADLLNGDPVQNAPNLHPGDDLDVDIGPITEEEILKALRKIKNGKAPGPDQIPPEVMKINPEITCQILKDLLDNIWETEEIPKDWSLGYIIKFPKKGDLGNCQNWRGIQLLSLPSKVLARVVLERIKEAIDNNLRDEQAGFRCGRSCTDQIATLRIIIEQSLEWQSPLYINFVDFKKAFDMVDRDTLWKVLCHYGIPDKLVKIIQGLHYNNKCQVIHNSTLSPSFSVHTGVRQGCLLSPLIFSVVIDWIMRTAMTPPRGIQWSLTAKLEDLDFADDVSLLSHQFQQIQLKTAVLYNTAKSTGLEINTSKTKSLRINTQNISAITLDGQSIEDVKQFTYLGSIVSKNGGADEDIKSRLGKARHAFVTLRPIWKNKNISQKTKLRIFETNVKSVLLYGSETWKQTKKNEHDLQVFINKCLRQILQIRWSEKISNEELWEKTGQSPITNTIKKRKWHWIGHILRRPQSNITRQALDWNPQGKRRRGRPTTTWRRTIDAELKACNITWPEAKRAAMNRPRWRAVVDALCPTRGQQD